MKRSILYLAITLLIGCDTLPDRVATEGAEAADAALDAAEWGTCTAATVGAVRRKYGGSEAEMQRWRDFCSGGENAMP